MGTDMHKGQCTSAQQKTNSSAACYEKPKQSTHSTAAGSLARGCMGSGYETNSPPPAPLPQTQFCVGRDAGRGVDYLEPLARA